MKKALSLSMTKLFIIIQSMHIKNFREIPAALAR